VQGGTEIYPGVFPVGHRIPSARHNFRNCLNLKAGLGLTISMVPTLETPRLFLRPLTLADAPAIQAIFPKWEIVRYMIAHVPWPYPADGALSFLRDLALPGMARGDEWHWGLFLKTAPDQLIGVISLRAAPNDNRGFWIDTPYWGQGLMQEASEAVTDYWFDVLGFPVLRAPKAAPNIASRRISEKNGMRLVAVEDGTYVGGPFPREIWEITQAEWAVQQQKRAR
jgi:[ribosomal protein S5]-alanine N-acetyltransferase